MSLWSISKCVDWWNPGADTAGVDTQESDTYSELHWGAEARVRCLPVGLGHSRCPALRSRVRQMESVTGLAPAIVGADATHRCDFRWVTASPSPFPQLSNGVRTEWDYIYYVNWPSRLTFDRRHCCHHQVTAMSLRGSPSLTSQLILLCSLPGNHLSVAGISTLMCSSWRAGTPGPRGIWGQAEPGWVRARRPGPGQCPQLRILFSVSCGGNH